MERALRNCGGAVGAILLIAKYIFYLHTYVADVRMWHKETRE